MPASFILTDVLVSGCKFYSTVDVCDCIKVDKGGGQFEQRKSQNCDKAGKYLEKFRNLVKNIKRLKGVTKYFNFQGGK